MIIYKIINLFNDKFYIGQDSRNRFNYLGSGIYLKNVIKKYGRKNFQKETIAWCDTKDKLDFLEKFYIKFFNSKNPNGYNLTDGGEGPSNPSEEVRKKMSESQMGKHHSEESRKKIGEFHKGKPLSEEHKRKISESEKGRKVILGHHHSEETRKKISESNKGKHSDKKSKETRKKMSEARKGAKFINGHFLHMVEE